MAKAAVFQFKEFSRKQKKAMTWWMDFSPFKDYDGIICDGSIRSGKTIAMIDGFLTWSLSTFSNEKFIIAGKTMGALKRNVLTPMFEILTAKGIDYHYVRTEDPRIIIGNNVYYLFGAVNERSQDVLQGLTAAGCYGDEVALFPQSFVEQMIARCSVEGSKFWFNCNPDSPYHFVKTQYIDHAEEKRLLHLHFTLEDNLTLSRSIKERYKRMYTGLWYDRFIKGLWKMAEGAIYDCWDEKVHVVNEIPAKFDEYLLGVDYGTGNPTVFLLFGIAEAKLFLIDEYYYDSRAVRRQKTDGEYSTDLKKFVEGRFPRFIIVDPSAASFKAQLRKDGLNGVINADNAVVDGIRAQATFITSNKFFVYGKKCPNFLKEISGYCWDPKAQKMGRDEPIKVDDHCMDASRYVCNSRAVKGLLHRRAA